ncbi:hypothetical protein SMACR_01985 [Sordaria macrospora]|uniref:WGS project CABT00000000 data, contig 2.5 n=2 Tax=Sordaria macrospora TaxID=5147 RepID=F7VSF5_SORMK|nr:uncharacterized protein SMAC_01985 [Sordaria macrospora k-hell]KAA8631048.1 hypothetical protein SMACR_01985 [Sordaria macrospora]WPJ63223.1 hypothetical protein SMAC4_01985 [Sordaria macrospora]CCC08441.1 unnamed protein product [Sordaria macrospora k-hell]
MGDPGFVSLPQGTIARSQGQQQQQQQQQQQHQHPQHHLTSHQCSPSPVVRNTHSGHMGSFQPQSINSTPHPPPHHHHPQQPPQQRHSEMPQSSSPPHIAHPVSHQNSSSFSPNSLPGNISRRMTQSEAREALTTYLIYRLYQTDNAKWESTRNTGVLSDHQAARDMQALGRDDGIKLRDRLNKLNGLQRRCLEKRLKKMREREMRDPSEGGSYKIDLVGVEELSLKGENIKWKRGEVEVETVTKVCNLDLGHLCCHINRITCITCITRCFNHSSNISSNTLTNLTASNNSLFILNINSSILYPNMAPTWDSQVGDRLQDLAGLEDHTHHTQ